jgi:hypothetical protein
VERDRDGDRSVKNDVGAHLCVRPLQRMKIMKEMKIMKKMKEQARNDEQN